MLLIIAAVALFVITFAFFRWFLKPCLILLVLAYLWTAFGNGMTGPIVTPGNFLTGQHYTQDQNGGWHLTATN